MFPSGGPQFVAHRAYAFWILSEGAFDSCWSKSSGLIMYSMALTIELLSRYFIYAIFSSRSSAATVIRVAMVPFWCSATRELYLAFPLL